MLHCVCPQVMTHGEGEGGKAEALPSRWYIAPTDRRVRRVGSWRGGPFLHPPCILGFFGTLSPLCRLAARDLPREPARTFGGYLRCFFFGCEVTFVAEAQEFPGLTSGMWNAFTELISWKRLCTTWVLHVRYEHLFYGCVFRVDDRIVVRRLSHQESNQ